MAHFFQGTSVRGMGIVAALFVAACAGGGGCSSCGGEPIPGGFSQERVIENAGAARITRSGLDFIAANLPQLAGKALGKTGPLTFEIPESQQTMTVPIPLLPDVNVDVTLCAGGPQPGQTPPECVAEIDLGKATLNVDAFTPHSIRITGTVAAQLQSLPIRAVAVATINAKAGLGKNAACNGGQPQVTWQDIPITIDLPIVKETAAPRGGYARIDFDNAVINPLLNKSDVSLCWSCSFITPVCNAVAGFIKDQLFSTFVAGIRSQIKSTLEDALCTKPNAALTPTCPTGSQESANATRCVYSANPTACVPIPLGVETHMDLSKLLAGISPGTPGGLDFLFAGGGSLDPAPGAAPDNTPYVGHTPNGATLGVVGGAVAAPTSACVPFAKLTPPLGIPIPQDLRQDAPVDWPARNQKPDVGLAVAGRFLEYALGAAYNSGMLCLGITTEQVPQLRSGLVSVVMPSISKLTIEQVDAPIAIVTHPTKPPQVHLGSGKDIKTDPLIRLDLPALGLDFYVWSHDRFIRVFSMTGDLSLPINLTTGKDPKTNPNGGLLPSVGEANFANAKVTNSDLLLEDPEKIASSVSSIVSSFSDQLVGALQPIDLSSALSSLGLGLEIPAPGIRKVSQGTDDFVAVFATLTTTTNAFMEIDTQAKILGQHVDPKTMSLARGPTASTPTLDVSFSSPTVQPSPATQSSSAKQTVEFAWAIDRGTRSPWSVDSRQQIRASELFMQGKHVLRVWARIEGQPRTEDTTPAEVPFTIDVLPPILEARETQEGIRVRARDIVSDRLWGRWKFASRNSEWEEMPRTQGNVAESAAPAGALELAVKDESGNAATLDLRELGIRGKQDETITNSGCACRTARPIGPRTAMWSGLFGLALAALFGLRRRS